jgi:hypothetical protein
MIKTNEEEVLKNEGCYTFIYCQIQYKNEEEFAVSAIVTRVFNIF